MGGNMGAGCLQKMSAGYLQKMMVKVEVPKNDFGRGGQILTLTNYVHPLPLSLSVHFSKISITTHHDPTPETISEETEEESAKIAYQFLL
jgi:hypothetical protein